MTRRINGARCEVLTRRGAPCGANCHAGWNPEQWPEGHRGRLPDPKTVARPGNVWACGRHSPNHFARMAARTPRYGT